MKAKAQTVSAQNDYRVIVETFDDDASWNARYDQIINDGGVTLEDGQFYALSPAEILFWKWLGRRLLLFIIATMI